MIWNILLAIAPVVTMLIGYFLGCHFEREAVLRFADHLEREAVRKSPTLFRCMIGVARGEHRKLTRKP